MHIHINIHMYTYIYTYVYIHIYTCLSISHSEPRQPSWAERQKAALAEPATNPQNVTSSYTHMSHHHTYGKTESIIGGTCHQPSECHIIIHTYVTSSYTYVTSSYTRKDRRQHWRNLPPTLRMSDITYAFFTRLYLHPIYMYICIFIYKVHMYRYIYGTYVYLYTCMHTYIGATCHNPSECQK